MLEVRVLGPLQVQVAGHPVRLGGPRQQALLAILATAAGSVVSTDRLVDGLWGDDPPPSARNSLQSHVSRLRAALADGGAPGRIEAAGTGYVLRLAPEELDAATFEALAQEARHADGPDAASARLGRALALWRGEAFAGLDGCEPLRTARARLEELRVQAVEARFDAELAAGRHHAALAELEAAVAAHPLRERLWHQLVVALHRGGRHVDAVRAGQRYRRVLREETGLEPTPGFVALEAAVVRGELDVDPDERVGRSALLSDAIPGAAPDPLPAPRTTLLGRDEELASARRRLAATRLLTLTGVGGVGKTRFALELARTAVADHPGGVHLVELAALHAGDAIGARVADLVGARVVGGEPVPAAVARRVGPRPTLLVLDNCEHVLADVAELVAALLAACPALTVLATSRERLTLDGEHVWPLGPLSDAAAAHLLVERARAHRPGFTLHPGNRDAVHDIVRRLDGLPLALELAAARLGAFTPAELAGLLEEPFRVLRGVRRTGEERHRTLQAVLEWSWRLLDPTEQAALARISAFAAPFTLAAAAAVNGTDDVDTAAVLGRLVDASFLRPTDGDGGTRYAMLDILRRFAADRLAERCDGDDTLERHTAWVLGRAGVLGAALGGPEERAAADQLDAALADVRAVYQRLLDGRDGRRLGELLAALDKWVTHWAGAEAWRWALTAAPVVATAPGPQQGVALAVAGLAAAVSGDRHRSVELGTQARALGGVGPGDPVAVAALFEGRLVEAERRFRDAYERTDPADTFGRVHHLGSVALALAYQGRTGEACRTAAAAEREAEAVGAASVRAWACYATGEAWTPVEPERALAALDEAVELGRRAGAQFVVGVASHASASLAARHGDPRAALPRLAETLQLWHRAGAWTQVWTTIRAVAEVLARLGALEEAVLLRAGAATAVEATSVYGEDAGRDDALAAAADAALGADRAAGLRAAGADLDREQAVERALRAIDTVLAPPGGPAPTAVP